MRSVLPCQVGITLIAKPGRKITRKRKQKLQTNIFYEYEHKNPQLLLANQILQYRNRMELEKMGSHTHNGKVEFNPAMQG